MRILNVATRFKQLPSDVIGLNNDYEAFCFNEACNAILTFLEEEKKPNWLDERETKQELRNKNLEIAKNLRKRGGNL